MRRTKNQDPVEITEHHKIRGVFWERMELNHFPYDVQELSVSITTPLEIKDLYFTQNHKKPSGVNRTVFSNPGICTNTSNSITKNIERNIR
jgi:hypothetical protein